MQKAITSKDTVNFIIQIAKKFPVAIGVMLATCVIYSADAIIRPYIFKILLDRIIEAKTFDSWYLWTPALIWLACGVILVTMFRVYGYFVEIHMIPPMRVKIANLAITKLMELSYSFYQNNFAGSIANKVNDLTRSVIEILQICIDKLLNTIITMIFAVVMLWQLNSHFGIIMLTWSIIFVSLTVYMSKYLVKLSANWSEKCSSMTGKVVDSLSNILLIRLFSRSAYEKKELDHIFSDTAKEEQKIWWMYFWIWSFNGYSFIIVMIFNFHYLIKGYQAGIVTIGDFTLVLSITVKILDLLWGLSHDLSNLSKEFGRLTQGLEAVLTKPDIVDHPNAKELIIGKGSIEFDNVRFHYNMENNLFENKSLFIPAGQKVGLVGYSGGGKSSFVNLILRMFDVNSGRILIDEQDISLCTQDSLRNAIGMIPQEAMLFHRSLKENISYGKIGATDEEIIEASKRASAHKFICALKNGYDSLVGERGVKLSGGQRQRIAIARAILKNAPILILDEATSQMDSLTESDIQDVLWQLMQGKTTIVIAHRLSTLLNMDRILVFEEGKIIQDGTHDELIAKAGLYKTLWETQVGGFLVP